MTPADMKDFRARHGLTQAKLARLVGYRAATAPQNIIRYEGGRTSIPEPVATIMRAIDRSPSARLVFEGMAT